MMRKFILPTVAAITAVTALLLFFESYGKTVHLTFAGDILLDRGVRPVLEQNGYDYPYKAVAEVIRKADIASANLECPLTDSNRAVLKMDPRLIFKGNSQNSAALKSAGFDLLNLANNHVMDYSRDGLGDTIKLLRGSGVEIMGAGPNREEARKPVYFTVKGARIGFLGFSAFPPEGYIYDEMKADVARVDTTHIKQEIVAAKENCDFLVVQFHWGNEFEHYPSSAQQALAREVIDNGGDLVIGHHPHVLQSIERYKDKLIFYSLGNFVFDRQVPEGTDEALLIDIKIKNGKWKEVRIYPLAIKECRPAPLQAQQAETVIGKLNKYSKDTCGPFYFDKDKGCAVLNN